MSQLDLFAEPEPEPDPELVRLARRIPPHVRFGTSSWTFEGWRGLVYRRRYSNAKDFVRRSLGEYARFPLFGTVGVDRGYYAPIPAHELAAYAAQVPEGFRCCPKVWSEITACVFPDQARWGERAGTRNPHILDAALLDERVLEPLREGLGEACGPLIVEVPPGPIAPLDFETALERFLERAPPDFVYAFEVRSPQLLSPRYLEMLRAHPSASHVLNLHTRMPSIGAQLDRGALMGPAAIARLMLPPGQRYADLKEAYAPFDRLVKAQPEMRRDVARLIAEAGERGIELHVIANNKAEGCSPLTVRALVQALQR